LIIKTELSKPMLKKTEKASIAIGLELSYSKFVKELFGYDKVLGKLPKRSFGPFNHVVVRRFRRPVVL
jgi:hypothetical protein